VSFTAASTFSSSCRLHIVCEHVLSLSLSLYIYISLSLSLSLVLYLYLSISLSVSLHHENRWHRIWPRHRKRAGHRVRAVETRQSRPPSSAMATIMARCLHPRPVSQNEIIIKIHLIYLYASSSIVPPSPSDALPSSLSCLALISAFHLFPVVSD